MYAYLFGFPLGGLSFSLGRRRLENGPSHRPVAVNVGLFLGHHFGGGRRIVDSLRRLC